jgi:hypothetical protein
MIIPFEYQAGGGGFTAKRSIQSKNRLMRWTLGATAQQEEEEKGEEHGEERKGRGDGGALIVKQLKNIGRYNR